MTVWTCQRQTDGAKCGHRNPSLRLHICERCGKRRASRKRPAHLQALELDYAGFVELNGGEHCAICGREPSENRRLDRDHSHVTGKPRGLLCHRCNRALPEWVDSEWLLAAAAYLERSEDTALALAPTPLATRRAL